MLVDMHLHALPHSADSFLTLAQIVTQARSRGLDAVCLTDHDSIGGWEAAAAYSREVGFPIFLGVEYFSLQGDITAWGIGSIPDRRVEAQAFIDQVNAAGGFCCACHPFRNNNRGLAAHLGQVTGLHGVEVFNGSTSPEANQTALDWCRELGLQPVGASDAHVAGQVGKYATWLPERVETTEDFVSLLRTRPVRPAVWTGSGYELADPCSPVEALAACP